MSENTLEKEPNYCAFHDSRATLCNAPKEKKEPPKMFWKYYDLYRRKIIPLDEYAKVTGMSVREIQYYVNAITNEL